MDRYDDLDLDLECDGGGVAQKALLFGGMFKRSSKAGEPAAQKQDTLSTSSDLSKSSDSLSDRNVKDSVFKGMFKKTTKSAKDGPPQDSLSTSSELSKSSDSLADGNAKDSVFKGMFKKKSATDGGFPQVTLSVQNPELSDSNDSLIENNRSSKDKSGGLGGILRRSPKAGRVRRPSQDLLDSELSASNNSLSENTKETGGMFSGFFKKSPKPFGARSQSQEDLSAASEPSGSSDNLTAAPGSKETSGMFSGMFKKKPFGARTQSQDDLSEPSDPSGSSDHLSESSAKEKGGLFTGVFKMPKRSGARSQSQDDLSAGGDLSASTDSLTEKSSKGGKTPKNPFTAAAQVFTRNPNTPSSDGVCPQEKDKSELSGDSGAENISTEKPRAQQSGFSAMMKSVFHPDKQAASDSDGEETQDKAEIPTRPRESKLPAAMTKLNPFRSANKYEKQTGSDDEEFMTSREKSSGGAQVKSHAIQRERKEKSEPARPVDEDTRGTLAHDRMRGSADDGGDEDTTSTAGKDKPAGSVPARRSDEEPRRPGRHTQNNERQIQSDEETLKEEERADGEGAVNAPPSKTERKKPKHHNPFMPRAPAKPPSDDEGLKEDESSSKEEQTVEEDVVQGKAEETKVKKPKRHNPFMPRVKAKVNQRNAQEEAAENDGGSRSLFDQLEDYRVEPSQPENSQEVVDLMDWWNTVESWEDTPQDDDMTEKEEAKAFALTAEKVQKGIRVFNKLFSERAESLWQHVIDLNGIADGLDKFNKKTKIAQITGGSTSAVGGVATIAGLALAPFTMGTSLIVTAVGLGVATAGGLTSAGAGISNQVNNSMDRKKVEKIVEDYQEKMVDLNKCLKFIKQGIENLRRFDLIKMKKHAYNRDFPVLSTSFYEDGAMAGKAILINANEIMRVVQIANVAGSTAARAVQIASMATGVLTGLFVGMDIYFVAKDSKELKKGAKSEFAAKIREVATQLHEGLVELNAIREELQSTTTPQNDDESDVKKADEYDDSSEDEIDRIKKAIKKDIENREYV